MKSALLIAALLLTACGGGASPGGSAPTSKTTKPAAPADKPTAGTAAAPTAAPAADAASAESAASTASATTADGVPADIAALAPANDPDATNAALSVFDDMPTQDELDAAAAARITEEMADAEYERLKAEIEADAAQPGGGG